MFALHSFGETVTCKTDNVDCEASERVKRVAVIVSESGCCVLVPIVDFTKPTQRAPSCR